MKCLGFLGVTESNRIKALHPYLPSSCHSRKEYCSDIPSEHGMKVTLQPITIEKDFFIFSSFVFLVGWGSFPSLFFAVSYLSVKFFSRKLNSHSSTPYKRCACKSLISCSKEKVFLA